MRHAIKLALVLMFGISACEPSVEAIQTALAQTESAMPTATIIPFAALNLETTLITSGDLPPGYEASQIRASRSDFTKNAPAPDYFISQELSYNGSMGGDLSQESASRKFA